MQLQYRLNGRKRFTCSIVLTLSSQFKVMRSAPDTKLVTGMTDNLE